MTAPFNLRNKRGWIKGLVWSTHELVEVERSLSVKVIFWSHNEVKYFQKWAVLSNVGQTNKLLCSLSFLFFHLDKNLWLWREVETVFHVNSGNKESEVYTLRFKYPPFTPQPLNTYKEFLENKKKPCTIFPLLSPLTAVKWYSRIIGSNVFPICISV